MTTPSVDDDGLTGSSSEDYYEAQQQVTAEQVDFVLDTMKKEAPYDVTSIKQLFYGLASAFTKTPIHNSVTSRKTGAGKTHDLTLVSGYFPKRHVVALAGMSDKALFRNFLNRYRYKLCLSHQFQKLCLWLGISRCIRT